MRILRYTKHLVLLGSIAFLIAGCGDDLTKTNISPDQISADGTNPAFILTSALGQATKAQSRWVGPDNVQHSIASALMQYIQRDFIEANVANQFAWVVPEWDNKTPDLVSALSAALFLKNVANNSPDSIFLKGVSLTMSAYFFGLMSSAWGDMAYSQAGQAQDIPTPAFDKQQDIFVGILKDLEEANTIFATATIEDPSIKSGDILYNGDIVNWQKFANSLHLRFLMRLSQKASDMQALGVDVSSEFNKIFSNPTTYPIILNAEDNAAIAFAGTGEQDSWGLGPFDSPDESEYRRRKPAGTIVDFLIARNDPRLTVWLSPVEVQTVIDPSKNDGDMALGSDGKVERYFKSSSSDIFTNHYIGLKIALPDADGFNKNSSPARTQAAGLDPSIYLGGAANPFTSYLSPIWRENANPLVKTVFISAAEVNFTLAEAVERGWISGNGQDFFKDAIQASFEQYDIHDGEEKVWNQNASQMETFDLSAYLNNAAAEYNNASDKLETIITHEWASDFMVSSLDAWFNWRRTGFPNLGANLVAGPKGTDVPLRFPYSTTPKNLNPNAVATGIQNLDPQVDDQWSKVWLLQGTGLPY